MDSPVTIVLLTVIAIAAVAQAIFAAVLLARARDAGFRLEALDRELRPHLARMGGVIDDVTDLTEGAARRLPEIESAVRDTFGKVRWAGELVGVLAWAPLRPLTRGLAVWRALKRGADVYRRGPATASGMASRT